MNKSKLTLETETEHFFNTEYHKILNIFRLNDSLINQLNY